KMEIIVFVLRKVSTESDPGGFLGFTEPPRFDRTQRPSYIPTLFFHRCNNCNRIGMLQKLTLKYANGPRNGERLEMLLCKECLKLYNAWRIQWSGSGGIMRGIPY